MAKGIKSITGNTQPEVGVSYEYQVASFYPNTVVKNDNDIKWKLYVQNTNGRWRELRGPLKTGKKAPFLLPERWLGKTMMIEAYMYNPEIKAAPGLIVVPKQAKIPVISKVDLLYVDNTPGQVFSFTEKLRAKAECVNMFGKDIIFTLWEDSARDGGHNSSNKKIDSIKRPVNQNGIAIAEFSLTKALMMKAMEGEADIKQLEFYVTAEYYAHKKHATNNVNIDTPEEIKPSVPTPTQPSAPTSVPSPSTPRTPSSTPPQIPTQNPMSSQGGTEPSTPAPPEEPIAQAQANGTINSDQPPTSSAPGGTSPTVINEVKIEDVIDAYFAKKEYTVQTDNQAGTHEYKFGGKKAKNQTGDAGQKSSVADAILKNVTETLKKEKKYAKKEKVVEALIANEYGTDATDKTVTFPVFELGADFKKVSSAPLEDKLYLVAKTMLLDGKQATITIKEKDGIIKGSADAVLPVLEITEAQMEQTTPTTGAVQGSQKTEFTGTVKDNMVKIPIHLRPESDDELKQWKEKLGKGKEDGTYTYKFYQETSIPNGSGERKRIAGIILNNAKNGRFENPKIEEGKTAYQDDIENALTETLYLANKTISFKLYKKEKELLYLNVKAQGEKQHDKNFLKQEGAYFEMGKTKTIIFPLEVKPENDINALHKNFYWGGAQRGHQATFNSNRPGSRKHAGRDLYTKPYTKVVAICDGLVLDITTNFADGTGAVTVLHETNDGRKFIIRYGEVENETVVVQKNHPIFQGDEIGKTGFLRTLYRRVVPGYDIYMLHFEYFTGSLGFDINDPLSNSSSPFRRRGDLSDPLPILEEGYRNTFDEGLGDAGDRVDPNQLSISQQGIDFIKGWEDFRSMPYDDSEGFCTIGYGHLISRNRCANIAIPQNFANGITREEATTLFNSRLPEFESAVKRDVTVPLYQYEYDALVSLLFNTGENFLRNQGAPRLYSNLLSRNYEAAAAEFLDITNGGTGGLVSRRQAENNMFLNNIYDSSH